jgi:LDH2 family malate/lactate/ureidoglycolate dehydrogenase
LNFSISQLRDFAKQVFGKMNFSDEDALLSANFLTRADLRGVDSHGIARLRGYYNLFLKGRLNPKPVFKRHSRFPTLSTLDADQSIGFLSAYEAMKMSIRMARETGVGIVAVKNSNHFGIAGQYALMAAEENMIGMAMTNASPLVAPTFSKDKMLGTNPIAIAIPSKISRPFVLDMATTTAANGKLEILQRKNSLAPEGWIQKKDGTLTSNPNELKEGGALRPLGSFPDLGSHKGYGLGAAVDILSGVLSGANFGPWVPPFVSFLPLAENLVGEGIGHFFVSFRVDGFMELDSFLNRMEAWMVAFRNASMIDNQAVLVPGDPEWLLEDERQLNGVYLLEAVIKDLNNLAVEIGIEPFSR